MFRAGSIVYRSHVMDVHTALYFPVSLFFFLPITIQSPALFSDYKKKHDAPLLPSHRSGFVRTATWLFFNTTKEMKI